MHIFLSWSGQRSRAVADALHWFLPGIIQAVETWRSEDIAKGSRWGAQIDERLEQTQMGIVCLTPENLHADWILFEAGAIAKRKSAKVCTFLLDLAHTDVAPPLGNFQHTLAEKADVRKLLGDINACGGDSFRALSEERLNEAFESHWPRLAQRLDDARTLVPPVKKRARSAEEMAEETLETVRQILARLDRRDAPIVSRPPRASRERWFVDITSWEPIAMSLAQLALAFEKGRVGASTLVWRTGMPDWQPLGDVPELAKRFNIDQTAKSDKPPNRRHDGSGDGEGGRA
ncbi:MAG: hypothetical protein RL685_4025 [Pseudomonadota bacterium]|jgi:hypothetical protein